MIRLERIRRWPRLRRVEDWSPLMGEKCWFAQGGDHRVATARIVRSAQEGKVAIAIRGGTRCGVEIIGEVPLARVWPWKDWQEQHARLERDDLTELIER